MTIQIDARLHLNQPEIILRNPISRKVLMHWTHDTVTKWLENGDISYSDLQSPDYNWLDLLQSTR